MASNRANPRLTDTSVVLLGPTNKTDPSVPVAIISGVTATLRVYDGDRLGQLIADALATETFVYVDSYDGLMVGDTVELRLDDTTTLHTTTIVSLGDDGAVELAAGIPVGRTAKEGSYLLKPIGSSSAMTIYNEVAAAPYTKNWGYIGYVPDDIDLWDVVHVREEVDFDAGAGLRLFKVRTEDVIWGS